MWLRDDSHRRHDRMRNRGFPRTDSGAPPLAALATAAALAAGQKLEDIEIDADPGMSVEDFQAKVADTMGWEVRCIVRAPVPRATRKWGFGGPGDQGDETMKG